MIRTNVVKLTVIKAVAYRQKLTAGGSGITILRPDETQPGIASISNSTGEPIPAKNTNTKKYPIEAFKEAMELTNGMPFKKQKSVKVTKDMLVEAVEEKKEPEEVAINEDAYNKILKKYTDKNGKFSYELMNKDFIRFAKSSSVVRDMLAENKTLAAIRNYIVSNKFRNITDNPKLTDKEIKAIVKLLDEIYPKGIFKELDAELRKMIKVQKKK